MGVSTSSLVKRSWKTDLPCSLVQSEQKCSLLRWRYVWEMNPPNLIRRQFIHQQLWNQSRARSCRTLFNKLLCKSLEGRGVLNRVSKCWRSNCWWYLLQNIKLVWGDWGEVGVALLLLRQGTVWGDSQPWLGTETNEDFRCETIALSKAWKFCQTPPWGP